MNPDLGDLAIFKTSEVDSEVLKWFAPRSSCGDSKVERGVGLANHGINQFDVLAVGYGLADTRLVYVTPSHQSPTGVPMSMQRRREHLSVAEAQDMAIVEDDYDTEYRHGDRPLEPLYRLDRSGRVIYVGTFSKVLSPSLRLGFIVVPPALVNDAVSLRLLMDWPPPAANQHALRTATVEGITVGFGATVTADLPNALKALSTAIGTAAR